ncbi:AAA family ATPase [Microbacterium sp. LTA6]|uniref:AAA family ATPase n=1 Tax=unclassified Microbacterium TaxID=2609290 RepID=UPI00313A266C
MSSRMLFAADPLPFRPQRVLIAGVTGSGKTTLAARIGKAWGLRHVEIDALFHGPHWTPRPDFLDDVGAFAATERWITEWQYTSKGTDEIMTPRAQLVIWLDYPYPVVRSRLIRRTLGRSILRTRMYNGNVEKPIWKLLMTRDPDHNILAWQTKTLRHWTERMPTIADTFPHLTIVRLAHPRETEKWLRVQAEPGASTAPPKRRSRER